MAAPRPTIDWQAFGLVVTAHCRHRRKPPGKLGKESGVRHDIVVKAMDQKPVNEEAFEKLCTAVGFAPTEFHLKSDPNSTIAEGNKMQEARTSEGRTGKQE